MDGEVGGEGRVPLIFVRRPNGFWCSTNINNYIIMRQR